jgi:glycosyltransferase involved in cell wall biosynthesis
MHVWLMHIGEDLPVDAGARTYRYGYLADALVARGHSVLRWAPTFRHFGKQQRFDRDTRVMVRSGLDIQFVYAPGYRHNVGLARLRTYRVLDRRLQALADVERAAPDVIVAAIPSLEWAATATELGRRFDARVVVDVRDLWPDVFQTVLPRGLRTAGRWLLAPYRRLAQRACFGADALAGVSQRYLDWALRHAGREQGPNDVVAPIGFELRAVAPDDVNRARNMLLAHGVDPERPTCLFAGSFERSADLITVLDAAQQLDASGPGGAQFLLCGAGSQSAAIARRAAGLRNVILPGWCSSATIHAAASLSSIGLCAYAPQATQGLPNKPFEYMAYGLAVVSSLRGELDELISRRECGVTYRAGDATSLAAAIDGLTQHARRLAVLRANAHTTWANNYRSIEIYSRWAKQLEMLTSHRGGTRVAA